MFLPSCSINLYFVFLGFFFISNEITIGTSDVANCFDMATPDESAKCSDSSKVDIEHLLPRKKSCQSDTLSNHCFAFLNTLGDVHIVRKAASISGVLGPSYLIQSDSISYSLDEVLNGNYIAHNLWCSLQVSAAYSLKFSLSCDV